MQVLQLFLDLRVPRIMHPLGEEVLACFGEGALPNKLLDRAAKLLTTRPFCQVHNVLRG
jgi:hypothetical protein